MTMEGTLMACNMLGFSLGNPGPSTALGSMMAQKMAAPTRTAERQTVTLLLVKLLAYVV